LFGLLLATFHLPAVQQRIVSTANNWLEKKLPVTATIGKVYIDLPYDFTVEKVYLGDLEKDTLLAADYLSVRISLLSLLEEELEISDVTLRSATANLKQLPDGSLNLDPVINAFSDTTKSAESDTTTGSFATLDLGTVNLENIYFSYQSLPAGQKIYTRSTNLSVEDIIIQLEEKHLSVGTFRISKTSVEISQGQVQQTAALPDSVNKPTATTGNAGGSGWSVQVSKVLFNENTFSYHDQQQPVTKGFDPNHLVIRSLNLDADSVYYAPDSLHAAIRNLSLLTPYNQQPVAFTLGGRVSGPLNRLLLSELTASLDTATHLTVNGKLNGLPDADKLRTDLTLDFSTSRKAIQQFTPDSLLPVQLPGRMTLQAELTGSIVSFESILTLDTEAGKLNVDATRDSSRFNGKVTADNLNLGYLLQSQQLGRTDFSTLFNGELKGEEVNLKTKGTVRRAQFNQYTYRNISLATVNGKNRLKADVKINDKNFRGEIEGNMQLDTPAYKVKAVIDTLDLQALNFSDDSMALSSRFNGNFKGNTLNTLSGQLTAETAKISTGGKTIDIKNWSVEANNNEQQTRLALKSPELVLTVDGDASPDYFTEQLTQYSKELMQTNSSTARPSAPANHTLQVKADIKDADFAIRMLPINLDKLTLNQLEATFSSHPRRLDLQFTIPELVYDNYTVDSIRLTVNGTAGTLEARTSVKQVVSPSLTLRNNQVNLDVASGILNYDASIDRKNTDSVRFRLIGNIQQREDTVINRFSDLVVNYKPWEVDTGNIQIVSADYYTGTLLVKQNNRQVAIQTRNDESVVVNISDFSLKSLNLTDEPLLGGTLKADVELFPRQDFIFSGTTSVQQLTYLTDTLGNFSARINNPEPNTYDISAQLREAHELDVTGRYMADTLGGNLELDLSIARINLDRFNYIVADYITELKGMVKGGLRVFGQPEAPEVRGSVKLADVGGIPKVLGVPLTVASEEISFTRQGITLNNFTVQDQAKNTASISGKLLTNNFNEYNLNLSLNASSFMALNTGPGDNELYYGKIILDSKGTIRGTTSLPVIDLSLNVAKGSRLTYVVPEQDDAIIERKELVRFVDRSTPANSSVTTQDSLSSNTDISGIELNTTVAVAPSTDITVIIDQEAGDQLQVTGAANLSLNMNRTGNISLSGTYEVNKGNYTFTFYEVVKRSFELKSGSTITWFGDPYNPGANLTAVYRVSASPYDLFPGNTDERLRQAQPFLVNLGISGTLLEPKLNFSLDMPEEKQRVVNGKPYAAIRQINNNPSELNKQVFSLLILKSFLSQSAFGSEGAGTEAVARSSVSKLLNSQLGKLTNSISGINLNLNVNSYQTFGNEGSAGRTDLEIGLSKQLLDNRLTVSFEKNVNLEGDEQVSDLAGDVLIEYKLTKDGTYRVTAFRKSEQGDVVDIDGEVIETGVGITFIREYDKINELFNLEKKPDFK
jgi:hypothetical protein